MSKFNKNDVVQFNENHEWVGCFGFIDEIKEVGDDIRYMIGVPMPSKGTAYIFSMESRDELEYVGRAVLIPKETEVTDNSF